MHRDHPVGLCFRDGTLTIQFQSNLADGFDFRKTAHRGHVLIRKVIDNIEIVLQAVLDQAADLSFIKYPSGRIMRVVDHCRAPFWPGWVLLAYLLNFSDHAFCI
jgi:hypothetical protein